MSTEALNRIIREVNALTPQERRELIERLANEEQNSQREVGKGAATYIARDFDNSALSSLGTDEEEIRVDTASLSEWLNETRIMRTELPLTSDSVDLLRELREVRSKR